MAIEISVIIVNYQADRYVAKLKSSLRELKSSEIIVIDNTNSGRGYGEGCNLGAAQAKGRYFVFLNPDIDTTPESLIRLVDVLKHQPTVGLVGPQIHRPDGSIEISCSAIPGPGLSLLEYSFLRQIFTKLAVKTYRLNNFDHLYSRTVPSVGGSCLAMRAADFQALGGFDEELFLYFEEFDITTRLKRDLNLSTYFCAEAVVTHYGQVSTSQTTTASAHFVNSRRYWLTKTYGVRGRLTAWLLEKMEEWRG